MGHQLFRCHVFCLFLLKLEFESDIFLMENLYQLSTAILRILGVESHSPSSFLSFITSLYFRVNLFPSPIIPSAWLLGGRYSDTMFIVVASENLWIELFYPDISRSGERLSHLINLVAVELLLNSINLKQLYHSLMLWVEFDKTANLYVLSLNKIRYRSLI